MGYVILYGLTLFSISPEELIQSEIIEKDVAVIKRVIDNNSHSLHDKMTGLG